MSCCAFAEILSITPPIKQIIGVYLNPKRNVVIDIGTKKNLQLHALIDTLKYVIINGNNLQVIHEKFVEFTTIESVS